MCYPVKDALSQNLAIDAEWMSEMEMTGRRKRERLVVY